MRSNCISSQSVNQNINMKNCITFAYYTCTVSKSNIILNDSPSNYGVFTVWSGNYILEECIFDQNKDILLYVN